MNFSDVKRIMIPEGEVESIQIGEQTVWEKTEHNNSTPLLIEVKEFKTQDPTIQNIKE